jgi:hypothetical protein
MHQQSQVDNRQFISKGRIVQHEEQVLSAERRQDLCQKELPDHRDYDTFIGDEACQSPLNTTHLGLRESSFIHGFGDTLHHGATR